MSKKEVLDAVTEGLTVLEAKIMAILKLDDVGKLKKFFKGEVKNLNGQIAAIENNKLTAELELKLALSKADDKIEDAEAALEDAYTAVKVEEISSNESMSYFSERYWKNIDAKTESLESFKNRRKSLTEDYDKQLEGRNKRIEKLKSRIAKIS